MAGKANAPCDAVNSYKHLLMILPKAFIFDKHKTASIAYQLLNIPIHLWLEVK